MIFFAWAVIAFCACSKSNSGSTTPSGSTTWTLNGVNYTAAVTAYNDTSTGLGILLATDVKGDFISIIFFSHPAANGQYVVTSDGTGQANGCQIQVAVYSGGVSQIYTSTGKTGDMVTVTIKNGKLTAACTGVTVAYNNTNATVSGTVVQP